ncbi:hypothetical protein [Scytonema sp. NUACC26]|uniref:hypothetical protein n=1 Tax=Scytonema sp. NUACC26 TaxID=3140176 RepID=UPI0034DC0BF9
MRHDALQFVYEYSLVYLDETQVQYMDELHQHSVHSGRVDGYPMDEPSEPSENESAITVAEPQGVQNKVLKNTLKYGNQEVRYGFNIYMVVWL